MKKIHIPVLFEVVVSIVSGGTFFDTTNPVLVV